jgi:hypothetical protein
LNPGGLYEFVAFQAMEGGVERAFLDAQQAFGDSLNVDGDTEAMVGAAGQRLENQKIEGSEERIGRSGHECLTKMSY